MPELPEVETTVRGLRAVLDGQRLTHFEARRADLRWLGHVFGFVDFAYARERECAGARQFHPQF
jgi:formamidopyrimidine-DNA glycosylase